MQLGRHKAAILPHATKSMVAGDRGLGPLRVAAEHDEARMTKHDDRLGGWHDCRLVHLQIKMESRQVMQRSSRIQKWHRVPCIGMLHRNSTFGRRIGCFGQLISNHLCPRMGFVLPGRRSGGNGCIAQDRAWLAWF